jgi:hypothetical protein
MFASRRGKAVAVSGFAVALLFFMPVLGVTLSRTVWYPYDHSLGYGSLTYTYFGYGALFWSPNHYWIYFGNSVVQVSNSSTSTLTVKSIDQNGTAIFGYYTVLSDASGNIVSTGYTDVTFSTTAGLKYAIQVEGYGKCSFSHWSTGASSNELVVLATSGDRSFTAVYDC